MINNKLKPLPSSPHIRNDSRQLTSAVTSCLFIYFFGPTARHPVGAFHIAKQHSLVLSGLKAGEWCILKQSDVGWEREGGRERNKCSQWMFCCSRNVSAMPSSGDKEPLKEQSVRAESSQQISEWSQFVSEGQRRDAPGVWRWKLSWILSWDPSWKHKFGTAVWLPNSLLVRLGPRIGFFFFLSLKTLIAALLPKWGRVEIEGIEPLEGEKKQQKKIDI